MNLQVNDSKFDKSKSFTSFFMIQLRIYRYKCIIKLYLQLIVLYLKVLIIKVKLSDFSEYDVNVFQLQQSQYQIMHLKSFNYI